MQFRYFSFMTLTTVGYGDVLPRSDAARTLAALEAVMGQIYLTVLVARLVGLHIVHSHGSDSREKD
jgi:voltage-gated potassium channel Kch